MSTFKSTIKWLVRGIVFSLRRLPGGAYVYELIISNILAQFHYVDHNGTKLKISIPNRLSRFRAETFSTKEPETLEWIDSMPEGAIVWDIGANIGLYSCYAAKKHNCRVFAFEPSVFNLEFLARNVYANGLVDQITIIPLPLSDALSFNTLNMTTTDWGGALSSYGESFGHDGKAIDKVFEIPTIGITMADAIDLLNIPMPDYIKMDVDGIEHLILNKGIAMLSQITGILIEINDEFLDQAKHSTRLLEEAGLSMIAKKHSEAVEKSAEFKSAFNQIWVRGTQVDNR